VAKFAGVSCSGMPGIVKGPDCPRLLREPVHRRVHNRAKNKLVEGWTVLSVPKDARIFVAGHVGFLSASHFGQCLGVTQFAVRHDHQGH
jgi:hypothetical protein